MNTELFSRRFITSEALDFFHNKVSVPRVILSIMIFGVPAYVAAVLAYYLTGFPTLLSYGFLLAFSWLALAPYVIWRLENEARLFFKKLRTVVKDKGNFPTFVKRIENTVFSIKAYLCGVPFVVAADFLVFVIFSDVPFLIQLLMVIFLTALFLIAGIGFWGVISLIRLLQQLEPLDFEINPFHPDEFGGLGFVGSLTIQITLGFSTGSLVIPLALEAIMSLQSNISALVAQVLTGAYVFMILISFLVPTFAIHSLVRQIQYDYLTPISEKMKEFLQEYLSSGKQDKKERLLDLHSIYGIAARMKEWPFDFQVILKLTGSILLPIIILILQFLFGT